MAERAVGAGMSLSAYLRRHLAAAASRPSEAEAGPRLSWKEVDARLQASGRRSSMTADEIVSALRATRGN